MFSDHLLWCVAEQVAHGIIRVFYCQIGGEKTNGLFGCFDSLAESFCLFVCIF